MHTMGPYVIYPHVGTCKCVLHPTSFAHGPIGTWHLLFGLPSRNQHAATYWKDWKDYMITWDRSGREGWQLPCRMQTHSWPQQQLCGHWSQSFLLHLPQQSLLWIGTPTLGSWPLLEAESIWIYLNLVPSIRCFWRAAKHPSPDSDGIYTDFGFFKAGQPWHSDQWFRGANIPGFKV